jgi:hypothetical protein
LFSGQAIHCPLEFRTRASAASFRQDVAIVSRGPASILPDEPYLTLAKHVDKRQEKNAVHFPHAEKRIIL